MSLTLEIGKTYRTRDGCKVTITAMDEDVCVMIGFIEDDAQRHLWWNRDGTKWGVKGEHRLDIVGTWLDQDAWKGSAYYLSPKYRHHVDNRLRRQRQKYHSHQSRTDSFIEACINTAIGFGVSLATWMVIAPLFGLEVTMTENLAITGIFTVVSVARQYVLRRAFNGRSVWQTIKGKLG